MSAASKGRAGPVHAGSARSSQHSHSPLVVRYMRRMKRQRVYAYEVRWRETSRAGMPGAPVTVRMVVAGAQVIPTERSLDPSRPHDRAIFYVTPLARGWLRGERLEVLADGRKVQEIPLPSKVVSQRLTWVLLLLTFVVPWLWSSWIKQEQFTSADKQLGTRIERFVYAEFPQAPSILKEKYPDIADALVDARFYVKDGINWLHHQSLDYPIGFYLGAFLAALTLISLVIHRDLRQRRVGPPIPVPEADEGARATMTPRSSAAAVESFG